MSLQKDYIRERARVNKYISKLEREGVNVEFEVPKIPKKITPSSVKRLQKITPDKILEKSWAISSESGEFTTGRAILGTIQRQEVYIPETKVTDFKSEIDTLIEENAQRFQPEYPKQEDVIIDNVMDEFESAGYSYDANLNELYDALEKLDTFEPKDNWGKWYSERKRQQVKKLMQGINQAIDRTSKSSVAETFNNNAREFNDVIDRAIYDSGGKAEMADIDNSIDNMINSLMGAMSYEEAEYYGE